MKSENSYKDPSGYVDRIEDTLLYRKINESYQDSFKSFLESELYSKLIEKRWLIPIEDNNLVDENTIISKRITPLTYPYEWSYHQLKDAALLKLKIQNLCLKKNYSLKDATPFNIVFEGNKPYFVDYFSFERYEEGNSWVAFDQFMKMFYLPLLFRSYTPVNLSKNIITNIEGFQLSDYLKLIPVKVYFNYRHFINLILPYQILKRNTRTSINRSKKIKKNSLIKMVEFLFDSIQSMKPYRQLTTWNNYYSDTILENEYLEKKTKIIEDWLNDSTKNLEMAIDFGTNNGYFAKILAKKYKKVLATDIDYDAIDDLYLDIKKENIENIYPIQVELHNPSPAIGWHLKERGSFNDRFTANLGTVLAITHHLRITNNVPFRLQAKFFASIVEELIIEYVDKKDPKVQILLSQKVDVYSTYSLEEFKNAFEIYFIVHKETRIDGFDRVLFKMERK